MEAEATYKCFCPAGAEMKKDLQGLIFIQGYNFRRQNTEVSVNLLKIKIVTPLPNIYWFNRRSFGKKSNTWNTL